MTKPHTPEEEAQIRTMAADIHPRLLRFFRSKIPHPDCHDLAQQVFVAFLKQLREKVIDDPKAYLWGIARMTLLKFITRRRPAGEPFDSTRLSMATVGTSLSMHFDRRNRLTAALRELPLEHQLAFELRYGEELKLEEVAEAMEVSLATVKRYLKSGLERLRELLEIDEEEAGRQVSRAYRQN